MSKPKFKVGQVVMVKGEGSCHAQKGPTLITKAYWWPEGAPLSEGNYVGWWYAGVSARCRIDAHESHFRRLTRKESGRLRP